MITRPGTPQAASDGATGTAIRSKTGALDGAGSGVHQDGIVTTCKSTNRRPLPSAAGERLARTAARLPDVKPPCTTAGRVAPAIRPAISLGDRP
jgi:hypothetical protein